MQNINNTDLNGHALVPFNSFLKQNGRSSSSGYRWRKNGWIKTINISGHLYVSQDEIDRFQKRAAAGEFAKRKGPVFVYDDPMVALLKSETKAEIPKDARKSVDQEVAR
jgi:hypothetical protein